MPQELPMTIIPRIEQATAEQVRELLEEAFKAIFQQPATCWADARETGVESAYGVWQAKISRFLRLLGAEAWTSAAELLVPVDHEWSVNWGGNSAASVSALPDGSTFQGFAATPALALAAACLRAKGANDA